MIRFIDLRDQIREIEDTPVEFAFFDTVREQFVELSGSITWCSRREFEDDLRSSVGWGEQAERFTRKLPDWVA